MFKLNLSLQASSADTQISSSGNILTINGTAIDFSPLAEGEQCETELPLIGKARRVGGVIEVGVLLQYNSATAEPIQSINAADYIIELSSGPLPDVIRRKKISEVIQMETADAEAGN